MADNVTLTRVIDLVAQDTVDASVYGLIDSETGGTKKYPLGSKLVGIDQEISDINDETAEIKRTAETAYITDTVSGAVASFPDGSDDIPVKSLTVQIEPQQAGSGDPSPTNVRPISGWDSVKVARCGKNLIALETLSLPESGHEIKDNNGKIITTSSSAYTHGYIGVKPATTYTLSGKFTAASNAMYVYEYNVDRNWIGRRSLGTWPTADSQNLFITGSNTYYIQIQYINTSSGADPTTWGLYEGETVADDTEQGDTYTVDLGQTVYGGTLDVTSGVLTLTKKAITLNGSESWSMHASGKFFANVLENGEALRTTSGYVSNLYPFAGDGSSSSSAVSSDKHFYGQRDFGRFWVYDSDYTTVDAWKSALASTPMTIVYPLTTAETLTLTPEQVTTLLGQNNIYADAGSVSVVYRADTGLYIAKLTGSTETDMTADSNIPTNTYFMVGNNLYLSTAAIAAGEIIAPGTNCNQVTLAAALNALNQ